jgi:hypothetical protein
MWMYFSGMAGGGVLGKDVGITRVITIEAGLITAEFRPFILIYTRAGECSIGTVSGTGTRGTMNGFLTAHLNGTGEAGTVVNIGRGKELGAFRDTSLVRTMKGKN